MGDRESRDLGKFLLRSPQKNKKQQQQQQPPYGFHVPHPQSRHRVWTPAHQNQQPDQDAFPDQETNENVDSDGFTHIASHDGFKQPYPRSYNYYHNPASSEVRPDDPENVYHQISLMNGQINRMDLSQMKHECRRLRLDTHGKREAVKRRLKEHHKREKLIESGLLKRGENKNVDFFIVIDFEATCEERNPAGYKHEIIGENCNNRSRT